MGFARAILCELFQNLPLITCFVATVWLWTRLYRMEAVACLLAGSVLSALIIRFTEPIIHGYVETVGTTLINTLSLSLLMLLFAAYLGSRSAWSNWKTDILLGGLAGIWLGIAQGIMSAGDLIIGIVIHSLALTLAAPVVLIGIRSLKDKTLPDALRGAIVVSFMMTIVIGLLDYSYFLFGLV